MYGQEVIAEIKCGRYVQGILWGSDPSMNFVTGERVEMATGGQQNSTGRWRCEETLSRHGLGASTNNGRAHQGFNGVHTPPPAFYYKNWVVCILLLNIFVRLL